MSAPTWGGSELFLTLLVTQDLPPALDAYLQRLASKVDGWNVDARDSILRAPPVSNTVTGTPRPRSLAAVVIPTGPAPAMKTRSSIVGTLFSWHQTGNILPMYFDIVSINLLIQFNAVYSTQLSSVLARSHSERCCE